MANRKGFEGIVKVRYVVTISNVNAPTAAEVTAGTDLTTFMTKDGLNPGATNNRIQANDLGSTYDADVMGSQSTQLQLKFFRDFTTDTPRTLLGTFGTVGFIVVAPGGFTSGNTPTAGDKVNVYPIATGNPLEAASAANTAQTWTCDVAVTSKPAYNVALA